MDEASYAATTKWVKRALKDERGFPWMLVAEGDDSKPVFVVGKLEAEIDRKLRDARKVAKDKRSAAGVLKRDASGELVLAIQDGLLTPNVVQKIVRTEVAVDPGFKVLKAILRNLAVVAEAKPRKKTADVAPESTETDETETESPGDTPDPLVVLWDRIRGNVAKFEADPPAIDDGKLHKLLERLAAYVEQGGPEDVASLERRVRGELAARDAATRATRDVEKIQEDLRWLAEDAELLKAGVTTNGRGYNLNRDRLVTDLETVVQRLARLRDEIATTAGLV